MAKAMARISKYISSYTLRGAKTILAHDKTEESDSGKDTITTVQGTELWIDLVMVLTRNLTPHDCEN